MSTIDERIETVRRSKQRNRIAVLAGAGMTLVATICFLILPAVVPIQQMKLFVLETTGRWVYGNPFQKLILLGPSVGGLVTGYLAVDINGYRTWITSMKYGCIAAVIGVVFVYLTYTGLIAVQYVGAIIRNPEIDATIPHALDIMLVPTFFVLPLALVAVLEGLLAGAVGSAIRKFR